MDVLKIGNVEKSLERKDSISGEPTTISNNLVIFARKFLVK